MSYLVLARKYRPQTFDQVLGQEPIVQTLKNAILQNRVAHAFLFSGPRGVGKTSLARVLAKALNCQNQPGATVTPCGVCSACVEITEGSAVDVLEIDGASNRGIDNIRDLRETVRYMPASCRTKIYIIDEVHMLTTESFNALLKTLEEPPPHVAFMFATTEPHKVPATILSRCQRFDFHRVGLNLLVQHLAALCAAEGIPLPESSLRLIAREAEGSVRDALSLLDQVTSFGAEDLGEDEIRRLLGVADRTLIAGLCRSVLDQDPAAALAALAQADEAGHDIKQLAKELLHWFRNLMVIKLAREPERLMDVPDGELAELRDMAAGQSRETLARLFDQLARLDEELGRAGQPRLLLEMTLAKMALSRPLVPLEEIVARIESLEQRLRSGLSPSGSAGSGPLENAPLFTGRPEPAARPEPETGCAGSHPQWSDFLALVEKRDIKLYAILSAGAFAGNTGDEWRLSFPPNNPFLESLQTRENQKRLSELMAECFGEGHRLILSVDNAAARGPERVSPYKLEEERRREAMDDSVVQGLLDKLGGEILEIKIK